MKKRNFILSTIFNAVLIVTELWGLSISLFNWYPGNAFPMPSAADNFRFYTFDSNVLLLVTSVLYLVVSVISYRKKKEIPGWVMIFKFVATVSVLTTFLVVVTMLLPASGIGMISWPYFLFAHVIDPVLALVSFAFFEVTPIIKKRKCFYVVSPLAVYTAVVSPLASLKIVKDPYEEIGLLDVTASPAIDIVWKWCAIFFGTLLVGFLVLLLQNLMGKIEAKADEKAKADQPSAYTEDHGPEATPTQEIAADDVVVIEDEEGAEETEEEQEIKEEEEAKKTNPTGYMNRPRVYHIAKQAITGKWQVRLATGQKAIKLFDTQELAINYAKSLVRTQGGSIRVHSLKGKMRKE